MSKDRGPREEIYTAKNAVKNRLEQYCAAHVVVNNIKPQNVEPESGVIILFNTVQSY